MAPDPMFDNTVRDFEAARQERRGAKSSTAHSGGAGGGDNELDRRISTLEKSYESMDAKLDKILDRLGQTDVKLVSIEAKLDTKASATDLARITGRVESLPTTWQMITLVFGILGGAFLILRFGLPHVS